MSYKSVDAKMNRKGKCLKNLNEDFLFTLSC